MFNVENSYIHAFFRFFHGFRNQSAFMDELITVDNNLENNNLKCRLTMPSGVIHCDKDHAMYNIMEYATFCRKNYRSFDFGNFYAPASPFARL